ncbi:MAG: hypothetical protein WCV84_05105, partial [Patescibacteria group bacterium]
LVAAGVMDLRNGEMWCVERNRLLFAGPTLFSTTQSHTFGFTTTTHPAETMPVDRLSLGEMVMIVEMYYPSMRERVAKAFPEKGWIRNLSGAAVEMACVSTGQAVAFLCDRQKQDVGGAGYLLVLGAGGHACDFEGNPLDDVPYLFRNPDGSLAQTPMILGANKRICHEIVERFKRT